MEAKIILALTCVSACLPSLATVRVQRLEQDSKQRLYLLMSGGIALMTILGALKFEPLMWLGLLLMVGFYLWFLFAPEEAVR